MKVIDLLNKIANGEELPKAVNSATGSICYYLYDKCGEQCDDRGLYKILNDEIEIIEEEKKIPEKINKNYNIRILDLDKPHKIKDYDMEQLIEMVQDIYNKQDEIIDYLYKLKDDSK